jgi:putative tricarboxylic transport membrane protein
MGEASGVSGAPTERRRAIRSPQDFAGGLALLVIAGIALWATRDLGGPLFGVGPGLLPRGVATLLGLIGLVLVATSLLKDGEALGRWPLRGPVLVFIAVLSFAFTVRTVGLAVAGPLVALIGGAASPETRFKELIIFAIVVTALSIGLFRYVLNLPIPILIIPGILVL